ncbi:hypothetical protein JRQ81_015994, partial [Phrynocephalus forsythii]
LPGVPTMQPRGAALAARQNLGRGVQPPTRPPSLQGQQRYPPNTGSVQGRPITWADAGGPVLVAQRQPAQRPDDNVSSTMKYSIFVFNFIFWVSGCVILGVSIWMRVSKTAQLEYNIDRSLFAGIELLIAVGCIIMVLGFLGCCGAIQESECMLLLFFIGLLAVLLLQIVAGILGALYKPQIEESLDQTFAENAAKLSGHAQIDKDFQAYFRKFEIKNKCCGLVKGQADWGKNEGCTCAKEDEGKDACKGSIYTQSCKDIISGFFKKNMVIVMGLAFGLSFIETLGMVFSMILYCQIQRR